MTRSSATSMFAALLDRSVTLIGELAADGRRFDRQAVVRIADIWDNNTVPLFHTALSRPGWLRERQARVALAWMAGLTPSRRAWMIEQAAIAGHRLEPMLPPPVHDAVHYRDYRGQVRPGIAPLTAAAVASVAKDYDLARAEVHAVRVERAGRELSGHVALTAPRRYAAPDNHDEAVVRLFLDDVRAVRFDSDDGAGATLAADPAAIEVRVGAHGHLRAASATIAFDDSAWHLSHAGRAADADTPHHLPVERTPWQIPGLVRGTALDAATVLRQAMLEIRSVRYPNAVGRVPLPELCEALAGAGTDVLAIASQPRAARNHAFRQLAEAWITASPSLARRIADHRSQTVIPTDPPPPTVDLPARAQLTLASYTASHIHFGAPRDALAVVNLAVADGDDTWGLRAEEFEKPARLSLRTAAFSTSHALSYTAGVALSLGDGAFTVTRTSSPR